MNLVNRVADVLRQRFGDVIDPVILFGSRASARALPDSDFDILVVLNSRFDWRVENAILDACFELDLEYDILSDVKVISREDLDTWKGNSRSS